MVAGGWEGSGGGFGEKEEKGGGCSFCRRRGLGSRGGWPLLGVRALDGTNDHHLEAR